MRMPDPPVATLAAVSRSTRVSSGNTCSFHTLGAGLVCNEVPLMAANAGAVKEGAGGAAPPAEAQRSLLH